MATKLGLATISGLFAKAYRRGIAKDSYPLWQRIFRSISDEDLEKAAWHLIEWREKSTPVTPGEMHWALRCVGVSIKRTEDAAIAAAMERQFPVAEGKEITLAEFRKTDKEGGQAIASYTRRE